MKKIKVLRIIARLNIGGPAIHTVLLTAGLDKGRFESVLVRGAVSPGEGDMAYYARERGVRPIYVPELRRELNPLNDLIAFIKIFRIIKAEKPDIVHTHTAKAGALGRAAGVVYNCWRRLLRPACGGTRNDIAKLIHTFHGHIFEGYFGGLFTRIFIVIERVLACFTTKIVTVSEEVRKELISLGVAKDDKIAVIPLGFELERFLGVDVLDCPVKPGNDIGKVGIVGRLAPVKNHRLFLEAAARIIKEKPQLKARFKIVGDGQLRSELEEYARELKIEPWVEFTGWQRDLPAVYSDLDVVCLTSLNEGTPVSLIEAMACARVVVATEVGGVPDLLGGQREIKEGFVIRERGVGVKPMDGAGFARALIFVLENEEIRKNLSKSAREYVKAVFSKERLIRDIENLYIEVNT